MSKIFVVDRIEENIAVCENRKNRKMMNIELSKLPEGTKEGTVLRYRMGRYTIDLQLQNEIEQQIQEKMNDIWND